MLFVIISKGKEMEYYACFIK